MSDGALIGVVGPSGVGKDSVMQALAEAEPSMGLVRRVITRPEAAGGEDFEGVSEADFARRREVGEFVLHWPAHGLHYGVPATVKARLAGGETCLVNLSRAVLGQAERLFERFVTLHLTAPAEVLAERLAKRGREDEAEMERRLSRQGFALPEGLGRVIEVANDGPLERTVATVLARLQAGKV
ncbi:phosphonate metabolism protein/1,5-bisphosphokinase (PRPP-forming) PhnN [Roseovarius sp.]|uniref:phosphonate metabolism protein/1,5-bisphosphokinase (PRPP-forming) PhnN n=1 Tax=Roseovarius sp. TaxID=1486281 RepID=UPI003BAD2E08